MSDNPNTQRYIDLLHTMLDIAQDVAKDIHAQSKIPAEPGTRKPDYTVPIERITRTIRRTILLALKVVEPAPKRSDRTAARKRILREVEDHIIRNTGDPDDTAALQADLLDRLDSQELEDEIDSRPVPEIIIDIVRDLGLDTNWGPNRFKHRTTEEVALLAARAAELLPTEPHPPRPAPPRPKQQRPFPLPSNPARAVAMVLEHHTTNRDHPSDKNARLTEKPRPCSDPLRSEQGLGQTHPPNR